MGNSDSKISFQQAIMQLGSAGPVAAGDVAVWDQLCQESLTSIRDVFSLLPAEEIRKLREDSPTNLSTLCYKIVEKLTKSVESSCRTSAEHQTVLNSCRLLTRLIPYIFEDPDWRSFFWSKPEPGMKEGADQTPLGKSMMLAICDLLFCPEFTVSSAGNRSRDEVDELINLDSCEYIWEKGVGFAQTPSQTPQHHHNRVELLRLILTCCSESIYLPPTNETHIGGNKWVHLFTSPENRHALPLFTSLINTVCGYDPAGVLPYNHLIWADSKETLVEMALQVLVVTLDQDLATDGDNPDGPPDNLFLNYLSRIHREEDFQFMLSGITRLLMNPLVQTYLPGSQRKVHFHQELLIFFWKLCEHNRKFMFHVLKSSDVLEIIVPILHYLNDARADHSRGGLMHIGVFILLLLSGERNFGVRLNKPYTATVPMDIPVFSGSHADLLIIVFHKIITTGHQRLQPLFDCLLTILCNISPYLKSMSMTAACKLIHLVEAFSTPWFLMSNQTNHNLVFFLLEMLNNIIQYQFDGNYNLVYTMIRKRTVFHQLANLPTDCSSVQKNASKKSKKPLTRKSSQIEDESMEGSQPARPAEPGTLKASLMKLPRIENLTEDVSAHPSKKLMDQLTQTLASNSLESGKTIAAAAAGSHVQPGAELGRGETAGSEKVEANENKDDSSSTADKWVPTPEWISSWKNKMPLQTVMRMLQVLVPQVEKMCIDKGLTDESEILRFLQNGTLVGLLPVPHPILIRRYQANPGTAMWFRTYMWGVLYLRTADPGVWIDTDVKLFQVQRV